MGTVNEHRKVSIVSATGADWKTFISQMTAVSAASLSSLKVPDAVNLYLAEETYSYVIKNNATQPVKQFIDTFAATGVTGALTKGLEFVSALKGAKDSKTFNPWFKHLKAWENTEPVNMSVRFDFKLGQFGLWNARDEVALPILALIMPVIPRSLAGLTMTGPFLSGTQLLGAVVKRSITEDGWMDSIGKAILSLATDGTYSVAIGNQLRISNAYVLSVDVTMSTNTDTDGYPISGNISMTFEGIAPPALINTSGIGDTRFFGS